jgi:nicotinamidase/pyrazinamidase
MVRTRVGRGDALVVVDMQSDFLPGGALGVSGGDEVVPVLNRYIAGFRNLGLPIMASRDWHSINHCSFRSQGGDWPTHCVAGTAGADFAPGLKLPVWTGVVEKGNRPDVEAISAFDGTNLGMRLRRGKASRLFIGGLATDYGVLATVRDALDLGFKVCVLRDAIRAVNLHEGDGAEAVREMQRLGARMVSLDDLDWNDEA